eukprot:25142_4
MCVSFLSLIIFFSVDTSRPERKRKKKTREKRKRNKDVHICWNWLCRLIRPRCWCFCESSFILLYSLFRSFIKPQNS